MLRRGDVPTDSGEGRVGRPGGRAAARREARGHNPRHGDREARLSQHEQPRARTGTVAAYICIVM